MSRFLVKLKQDPNYHAAISDLNSGEALGIINFSLQDDTSPFNKVFNRVNGGTSEGHKELYEFKKSEENNLSYTFITGGQPLGYIVNTQDGNSILQLGNIELLVAGKVGFWFKGVSYKLINAAGDTLFTLRFKNLTAGFEIESLGIMKDFEFQHEALFAFVYAVCISYPILVLNDMNTWT